MLQVIKECALVTEIFTGERVYQIVPPKSTVVYLKKTKDIKAIRV